MYYWNCTYPLIMTCHAHHERDQYLHSIPNSASLGDAVMARNASRIQCVRTRHQKITSKLCVPWVPYFWSKMHDQPLLEPSCSLFGGVCASSVLHTTIRIVKNKSYVYIFYHLIWKNLFLFLLCTVNSYLIKFSNLVSGTADSKLS